MPKSKFLFTQIFLVLGHATELQEKLAQEEVEREQFRHDHPDIDLKDNEPIFAYSQVKVGVVAGEVLTNLGEHTFYKHMKFEVVFKWVEF